MIANYDFIIVGAGPVGCVLAEKISRELGQTCLIVEKRNHIAGNCYDYYDENGILVHKYGPHYFRTDQAWLVEYLSRFTEWIPGNYIVKSEIAGKQYPFPINLQTLEFVFGKKLNGPQAMDFLESKKIPIAKATNLEERLLADVGQELYEKFYLNYNLKQWGKHPRELEASLASRVPVRFDYQESYVNQKFQLMPAKGFTEMFRKMLDSEGVRVLLGTDFFTFRRRLLPTQKIIYCGPVDEFYNKCFGELPYRSLRFEFINTPNEKIQPCVQINYPNENAYTRSVEYKHVTGQHASTSTLSYEYPSNEGEPFYPMPTAESKGVFAKYSELCAQEKNTYFCGRLAEYKYLNTDQAIESAFQTFARIKLDAKFEN